MAFLKNDYGYVSRFMRFDDIVFVTVFLAALLTGTQMLGIDSDLGRHLVLGDYILDLHGIPTKDILSHTLTGHSRPPYEWASQVVFAVSHRILRLDGVILLTAAIISLTFLLLYQHSNRRSNSPLISLLLIFLAAPATSIHWLPRPHMVTILLLVIWIDKLEQMRKGNPIRLSSFPMIMLIWANLHGGFIFGLLALGAYGAAWAWERWMNKTTDQTGRTIFLAGILSLAASVVTPDLWRNWGAVLNNRSVYILSRTTETMPPVLTDPTMFPFTLLLFLTIVLFAIHLKSSSASHIFLLTGLGFTALLMARNIPLFAVACVPILSELSEKTLTRYGAWSRFEKRFAGFGATSRLSPLVIVPVLLAALFFAAHNLKTNTSFFQFDPQVFPVRASDWLDENPQQGNMFNEFNWGGYLLDRMWPHQRVFLDSQSDFYGEPLMREYETMLLAQGNWLDLLGKYQVDWVIIPPESPLADSLKNTGWVLLYGDETAVILARK